MDIEGTALVLHTRDTLIVFGGLVWPQMLAHFDDLRVLEPERGFIFPLNHVRSLTV